MSYPADLVPGWAWPYPWFELYGRVCEYLRTTSEREVGAVVDGFTCSARRLRPLARVDPQLVRTAVEVALVYMRDGEAPPAPVA
jgi:hypothetical protein